MTDDWDPAAFVRDYGDPLAEAAACRQSAALFDFSFMSRAEVRGPTAQATIGKLTRRSLDGLKKGRIRYAFRETDQGSLTSDLTVWRYGPDHYEVMSGVHDDVVHLQSLADADTTVSDLSAQSSIFAVQGPGALAVLKGLGDCSAISALPYFGFCRAELSGHRCVVGRLGYTGEPGFEIILPAEAGPSFWRALESLARPAGFAAIDLLRIEAGFVLFANEFRMPVSATEIGYATYTATPEHGSVSDVALVCFRAHTNADPVLWRPSRRPVRPTEPGILIPTSACRSFVAKGVLGLGFILARQETDRCVFGDPSETFREITLTPLPHYDSEKIRPRRPWSKSPQ